MVRQTRAFQIQDDDVIEIAPHAYNALNKSHVLAQEIAFGSINDPLKRDLAVWFDIPQQHFVPCSPQEAIIHKRQQKKKLPPKYGRMDDTDSTCNVNDPFVTKSSSPPFFLHLTPDTNDYELASGILNHCLDSLKAKTILDESNRQKALASLKERELCLQSKFQQLKQQCLEWSWPVNKGREVVDEETDVPRVDE
eukprot:9813842-Ditylum_brightwellii.AAC.1